MKKVLKILLIIPLAIIVILALTLGFFTITAFRPAQIAPLTSSSDPAPEHQGAPGDLNIVSWNLGYAGLDEKTDFVMEGGSMGRPRSRQAVEEALAGMKDFLIQQESDVYFIQEADTDSSRSWNIDQTASLGRSFPEYYGWYAQNYKALFVPYPPSEPIGAVDSGLVTLSRYYSKDSFRYQLPGSYSWPTRIFHLKRCALIIRIPSAMEGRDWCLINIHLSAYGDGSLREQQLTFLKEWITELYNEGHYVVVGGDWNTLFPGTDREAFAPYTTPEEQLFWLQEIPGEWSMPGWQWCFDPATPSARALNQPFIRGENFETTIDGFYVSPNIEIRQVRGFDLAFKWTDHNPVSVTLRIRE